MSKLRILLAVGVVGASILAFSTYQSQPNDPKPSNEVVEQVESKEPLKTAKKASSDKLAEQPPEQKVEPKKSIVERNPNNCDHDTQWIWEDGSCHDKQVEPKVVAEPKREQQPTSTTSSGDCAKYRPLVEQYDWNVDTMMRIMKAESGCNPTNHNWGDNHRSCLGSYGLFQIGCVHGVDAYQMEFPTKNVDYAYRIWKSQGYTAWGVCGGIVSC